MGLFQKKQSGHKPSFTVFFDVDGVLNKKSDWRKAYALSKDCVDNFALLCQKLSKRYAVSLVITSTWRAGLTNDGSTADMSNLEKELTARGLKISGMTPISKKGRQVEVEYYIRRNGVTNHIILDDDLSLFTEPDRLNLYVPDYNQGLTKKDVDNIIKAYKKI